MIDFLFRSFTRKDFEAMAREGVQYANVALINELTVTSAQRAWQ